METRLTSLTLKLENLDRGSKQRAEIKREIDAGRATLKRVETTVRPVYRKFLRLQARHANQEACLSALETQIEHLRTALKNVPKELGTLADESATMSQTLANLVLEVIVEWDQQRKRKWWARECERRARLAVGA